MIQTFFSIIGFLAVAAALLVFFCDPMLDGLARRCTARRVARAAYWRAYDSAMRREGLVRVIGPAE
jgi:hypothetical protein